MSCKCYITGAGEHFQNDIFLPDKDDLVIAADGGYSFHQKNNIRTDIIIGDFDSLQHYTEQKDILTIKLNPIKDETDTLCAVNAGIERGFMNFHLFGCYGGRSDHTFANIQTLTYLAEKGMQGFLYTNNEIMTVIKNSSMKFCSTENGYISVFSLDKESFGVSEKGLKYEIDNYTMKSDFPIGVSNEFTGKESTVSVKKGTLLIIYPRH